MRSKTFLALLLTGVLAACGGEDADDLDATDTTEDSGGDTGGGETDTGNGEGDTDTGDGDTDSGMPEGDADTDVDADDVEDGPKWEDPLTFAWKWPFERPDDPLAGTDIVSCSLYQDTLCDPDNDQVLSCEVYNVDSGEWMEYNFEDDDADMTFRAYLYDRWYDLHAAPQGQTGERYFTEEILPGTPEDIWSDPALFRTWTGMGDSAIWTGTALNAYIMRYLATGTEADYERMVEKAQVMVNFFEVTGIPGYLARYHYLHVGPEDPLNTVDYVSQTGRLADLDHRDIEDPEQYDFLPAAYFEEGAGTPRWSGDPSIDQYGAPLMTLPAVYGMLGDSARDVALKEQIAHHLTCYFHSLRRIEIINLQQNAVALDAFQNFFNGGQLQLDPGDMDFESLDTIVLYVHPQINANNEGTYPRECGDFVQMEPWRVLDATKPSFALDMITFAGDINRDNNGKNHINHFYIPSIRGGDAMHLMNMALFSYAFTGDERYADFLTNELMGNIHTHEVVLTMSALLMPKYCRRFYGTNITASPLWAFVNLLDESELKTRMERVWVEEMWGKETFDLGNVNTNLMFAGCVSEEAGGAERQEALDYALEELARFGGNGGYLADPRRTYYRNYEDTVDAIFEEYGIEPECMTALEREYCERPLELFGATFPGETVAFECTGHASECVMDDGQCTRANANAPVPGPYRYWGDYSWQRSPFVIGDEGGRGTIQSPGSDYSEQFWMARQYGFLDVPQTVLAWRATPLEGASCP